MNDPAPNAPRDPLSATLQSWRHEATPTADFNASVWSRIRSATPGTSTAPAAARIFHFPGALPLAASLAIILSLAAGTGGAVALNRTITTDRMAAAYVRTIDPVQMTAPDGVHATHDHP